MRLASRGRTVEGNAVTRAKPVEAPSAGFRLPAKARLPRMDALTAFFLIGTGFLGGIITAVVGGSSIICFPAMLAVGLPPIVASASNTAAVVPAHLIAAY